MQPLVADEEENAEDGAGSSQPLVAGAAAGGQGGGTSLAEAVPGPLLERVLVLLDLQSVCSAASSCKALSQVSGAPARQHP